MWAAPLVSTFHTLAKLKLKAKAEEKESERRISSESETILESHGIVVSTESEGRDIKELYFKSDENFTNSKIRVIPPGVDLEVFKPGDRSAARNKLGLTNAKMVLYAGRLEPLKGIDIAIEALAKLDTHEIVNLIVVGGDSTSEDFVVELKRLAGSLGISERVKFIGSISQPELADYYRAADVLIFPSYYESFGLVALEAMVSGIPVVASRVGGLTDLVKNGETGYLVPFRCAESFTEKLEVILANPSLQEAMGASARSVAMKCGWKDVAKNLAKFYMSLSSEFSLESKKIIEIV